MAEGMFGIKFAEGMFGIKFNEAKKMFFEWDKVLKAEKNSAYSILSNLGAKIWRRAKTSIKPSKKTSLPGKPPRSHTGTLRDLILFAYDESHRSTLVGPTLSNRPTGAPATLEYGGEVMMEIHGQMERKYIKQRPYMYPAMEKELAKMPPMWRNSIR